MDLNKNLLALWKNHQSGTERKPIVCLEGSARSGKTYSALIYLINVLAQQKLVASVFRHDAARHDAAALADFKNIMFSQYLGLWVAGRFNSQTKTFTFGNGSVLQFTGTNDPAKLHGPARHIALINEVNEVTYEAFRQIRARTSLMLICDLNPSVSDHWIYERVMKRDDCLYVHSTFRDNPFLSEHLVREIESLNPEDPDNIRQGTADAYAWSVYGLGLKAKREGAIYTEYHKVPDHHWPKDELFQRHGFGLDFGYSADPTALVECGLWNSKLFLREWVYETGLITCRSHSNPNIASIQGRLEQLRFKKNAQIVADSARPEQISELNAEGYCVISAKKGPGSVVAGIDLCKRVGIVITEGSTHLETELSQYSWRRKPDGTWLDEPEDRFNHLCDAFRYWSMENLTGLVVSRDIGRQSRVARSLRRY